MIADLKPYPEYRESGLPWLGKVPAHWEVRDELPFVFTGSAAHLLNMNSFTSPLVVQCSVPVRRACSFMMVLPFRFTVFVEPTVIRL